MPPTVLKARQTGARCVGYFSAIVADSVRCRWVLVCVAPDTHQTPTAQVTLVIEDSISQAT